MGDAAREKRTVEPQLRNFEKLAFLRQRREVAPCGEIVLFPKDRRNALRRKLRPLARENILRHRDALFRRLREAERHLARRFELAEFGAVDAPRLCPVALREFVEARRQVEDIGRVRRRRG